MSANLGIRLIILGLILGLGVVHNADQFLDRFWLGLGLMILAVSLMGSGLHLVQARWRA